MYPTRSELTMCEVLSDPVIGAVMRADRVTPGDIEAMLTTLAKRRHVSPPVGEAGGRLNLSCAPRGACEI